MTNANIPFNFRPVKNVPPLEEGLAASGVTIQEGQPLVRKADGSLSTAVATSTTIFGYAAHGVTGVTGTRQKILFYPAIREMVLEARVKAGTVVNLTEAFGKPVGLYVSGGSYYVDVTSTSTYCVFNTVGFGGNTSQDLSLAVVRVLTAKSAWPVAG